MTQDVEEKTVATPLFLSGHPSSLNAPPFVHSHEEKTPIILIGTLELIVPEQHRRERGNYTCGPQFPKK